MQMSAEEERKSGIPSQISTHELEKIVLSPDQQAAVDNGTLTLTEARVNQLIFDQLRAEEGQLTLNTMKMQNAYRRDFNKSET